MLPGLLLLPAVDSGEIAREEHVGHFPAVELGGSGVNRWCQQVVLEAVRERRGFVPDGSGDDPDHRIGDDAGGQLAAREHVVADRDLARDQVFADAVVDALVVAAEDNQVVERREAVGFVLVVADAVGRGVDHLVVFPFRFEGFDAAVDRFDLHYHTRLSAEGVVVRGAVLVFCVV